MADSKGEQLLDRLREYVQEQGEHNFLTTNNQPLLHSFFINFATKNMSCTADNDACTSFSNITGTGGELAPGWRVEVKTRNSGTSAGTSDAVSKLHCIQSGPCAAVWGLMV